MRENPFYVDTVRRLDELMDRLIISSIFNCCTMSTISVWRFSAVPQVVSYEFLLHVNSFRDRRYEYKGLNKVWKGKLSEAKASGNSIKIQEAQVSF